MAVTRCQIRPGAYADSIVLMQLQSSLSRLFGILDAGVVMGTAANLDLLRAGDLLPAEAAAAGAADLLLVVKAETEAAADEALQQVDRLLARRRSSAEQDFRPRSLASAIKSLPEARWVTISVPGRYAARVAREALGLGRHVFLYSDNVSLADEVELKQSGAANGLLVMGPDCGTAILQGIGLGFANRVRRGRIGLVGASGTGLQAITSRLHALGAGVSHALGTGGRDLAREVGAVTARLGLDLLDRDPGTEVIVLVSKPPAPEVASRLLAAARAVAKPLVVYFLGASPPLRALDNLHFVGGLEEAAGLAVELQVDSAGPSASPPVTERQGFLRGIFAGGTLAEAGASVVESLPAAIQIAVSRLSGPPEPVARPVDLATLSEPLAVVNVGLESFYDSLRDQGAEVLQVEWRPPAGGDERLMALLDKMKA